MKQQTAVEWYHEQMVALGFIEYGDDLLVQERLQKALEMEKEQIINAIDGFPIAARHLDGQEYYNQIYGKETAK
jgi:hypothetical protein